MFRFRPLAGKLRAKTIFSVRVRVNVFHGFRPLAGKLRAKTPFGQEFAVPLIPFPSPCGEIKGQNAAAATPRERFTDTVSVPLRGN